ncbi:disintegrin and metalloproteinase domain-containing protein 10 isoform X1 [Anopheles merus]|uniref:disintegrin and metalloproteinase domain-containing protein 10 isoform X1 n=1 Tax=Anopheles merus TaxID=30066 RepID=UPI001BE496C2|nr:disintegrin and metalloproteinase domain-containing protein 10 isoform X1 [Anopheles merus]XP_041780584.1 disintegrin and metalloproteinase domain-containing protein 10 isoform X1 [Anopheles merus]XP_041780585.1 disintegrin and metalloproteinase domain-containing protein 10 isoform X1 [Anopheles merus]XP_041780586.1 disintegrin and metalloproteinase domain-containing protein 10 isoform X1 [Anopheles merus]XP_041780587.1 disintegrin and metalloproteinase domain-containing protein 10 isoform X
MHLKCGLLLLFMLLLLNDIESGYVRESKKARPLNEYISHYEKLSYDHEHLHASHSRAKRSVTKDHYVHLSFSAHDRDFNIRLKRDLSTISDKLEIHTDKGPVQVDSSHIYHGEVIDDPNSYVFGSIFDGVFEGKVITSEDEYYVERAKHYFRESSDPETHPLHHTGDGEPPFHSVIYKDQHVDDPYRHRRKGHPSGCGVHDEVSAWMDRIQNSAVEETEEEDERQDEEEEEKEGEEEVVQEDKQKRQSHNESSAGGQHQQQQQPLTAPTKHKSNAKAKRRSATLEKDTRPDIGANDIPIETGYEFKYPYEKYSKAANWRASGESVTDSEWHWKAHERVRRAARPKEDYRNTCSLYIQSDPLLWSHIRDSIVGHLHRARRNELEEKTREEILSLIIHHITAVNYIYRNTKFDGRIEHRNIRFEVQRLKIDDDSSCGENHHEETNPLCLENIDVSNFLNLHSLGNHEAFCLAYVFTYRDFTGGTLGLAWVASASGASGGICEKYKTYTETVGGLYQSTKRSLNTGIITFVNYNTRVPPKVSQLTLAHEIGHNFGSPHDYPAECRPGGNNGNYIMFASATSGIRLNNGKFSPCSVRNISNVLDAIDENKKRNCFQASEGAFCGNKIVEIGEECDCGFNEEECMDKCCYPREMSETMRIENVTAQSCGRRARTQCSPSQGPCCDSNTCRFIPADARVTCKEETECSWGSTCNGTTPECPEPKPRDDKTKCNNGTQLCIKGECSGSICLLWNMTECFLTSNIIPNIDKRKLCELACQNGNDTNSCRSTSEFAREYGLPDGGYSLRPGSPCDNFQGYCDVFLKCRAVDAEGALVRLKNLLFNKQTLQTLAEWATEHWYLVCMFGIAFIITMGIFIKCCAVHTPSSNPKKAAAYRISDTLRRPMNTLRMMRRHHHNGAGPRSVPVPRGERSRSAGERGGGGGGGGGGRGGGERNGGRGVGNRTRSDVDMRNGGPPAGHNSSSSGNSRPSNSSRPPAHGYGEGRGQQYYPPKAPPSQNYSRMSNAELYAEAYPDRGMYEPPRRPYANNKV